MRFMELLAPAGNLEIGIYALKAGADALYLGLQNFSARKFAGNFSWDDLRRIKEFAQNNKKKIFCTLNTLIYDQEIEEMHKTLQKLQLVEIDGVIIQDTGLLNIIKKHFSHIRIHASTQMAVHNNKGIEITKDQGISRVVLSRELPFSYIKYLREKNPSIELEVFIHGALCYSFSGMCLWSGLELGRSANRGECAQICRNFFETKDHSKKYLFSCNDLALAEDILQLKEIGVNSLKIEGRMKDSSYVVPTVKYYRSILDSSNAKSKVNNQAKLQSQISFARKQTKGYFYQRSGNDLINPSYAGHLGILVGKIKDINYSHNEIKIELNSNSLYQIHPNDTLLIISQAKKWRFNAFNLKINVTKTLATIKINGDISQDTRSNNLKDLSVYVTQSSDQADKYPHLDYKNFPLYHLPIELIVTVNPNQISLQLKENKIIPIANSFEYELKSDLAKTRRPIQDIILEMFNQPKDSLFKVKSVFTINQTSWPDDQIFLSLSALKKIKNNFYQQINSIHQEILAQHLDSIKQDMSASIPLLSPTIFTSNRPLPFKQDWPFVTTSILNHYLDHFDSFFNQNILENLKDEDFIYLPIMPIQFDEIFYQNQFIKLLKKLNGLSLESIKKVRIGINNISHLKLAKTLNEHFSNLSFYLDIYAYAANQWAYNFWQEQLPNLHFSFGHTDQLHNKLLKNIPLFISCGCFKKHNHVPGDHSIPTVIINNKSKYKVWVDDCITIVMPLC
ncbi:MAG: hypothetical protein A2577_04895 [Bdellovibrionales bacterium RIFOXYD1_FULL_36_51]|nr:MAG: hypothetical protein A2577_04895 [Bdellovibrionales bacterium RIFOXYD1_FULL_36_51]